MKNIPILRSVLYVPASNPRALARADGLDADGLIFDLEDGVGSLERQEARESLAVFLSSFEARGRYCLVRLSGKTDYSAELVSFLHLDSIAGFVLPKVDHQRDILALQSALDTSHKHIWAMIETARGLFHLPTILENLIAPNLKGLIVGSNDLALETGLDLQRDPALARALLAPLVVGARAHGLLALDGVWNAFSDEAGFRAACALSRALGFDAKTLIHPSQIAEANATFFPTPEELADAHAIIEAFSLPENADKAVIALNGRMVERLHLEKARRIVPAS